MNGKLRVVVADDERPARQFLITMLGTFEDVEVLGEARSGDEAVEVIEAVQPDLALLDLQMPGLNGLSVVRSFKKGRIPLIVFVTAYDEYAIGAFDVEALDYLLKPVERGRLRKTLNRAHERLEQADLADGISEDLPVVNEERTINSSVFIDRIPVKKKDAVVIVPVHQIASVVAEGELMHITTVKKERHTISHRLKALEAKLDPNRFVRLGRGVLVNVETINKVTSMPGGSYLVTLTNTQQLRVSRSRSRLLRHRLLRL